MRASINATLENTTHITPAAYYRILAADLLPQDVHRALYLDGDIVCTGSLGEFFETDLNGCPVGMCFERENAHIYAYNRLGYPPKDGYYNSGVMLFDIDLWRRDNLTAAMIEHLKENAKRLYWHDQDLINAVLHGRIFQLDYSYNVMSVCFYVFYWLEQEKNKYYAKETQFLLKDEWGKLKAAVERPLIAHFQGPVKPWFKECAHPFTPVWRYFYEQSPWKNEPLKRYKSKLPAKAKIKHMGRKALERLNLTKASIPYPEEAYASAQRVLDKLIEEDKLDN